MNVVYLSYDGALDPLGRSQVVPVVEGLARQGITMHLVTFEKREKWRCADDRHAMERRLGEAGAIWTAMRYHRKWNLLSTAWDLTRALLLVSFLRLRHRCDLVHARSYPPALVAWMATRLTGVPYLFDMRALYADQRVDAGIWPAGSLRFRVTKWLEKRFLRDAAVVVTLTRASVPAIREIERCAGGGSEPEVIPTCVDLERFRPRHRAPDRPPILAYAGSIAGWYLLDEMLAFGKVFLETVEGSRLLFLLNASPGGDSETVLQRRARELGIDVSRVLVDTVAHEDVPDALSAATATIAFVRPAPWTIASAPTKISESWSLGLPVAVNRAAGDAAEVVGREGVGVVVDLADPSGWSGAAAALADLARSEEVLKRCREVAERDHATARAVSRYAALYRAAIGEAA